MTDKQIIFGVDVSKCPYAEPAYGSPKCRINGYVHCDGFRNCEYKQLKRKKQRIVELNKTIKAKEQECSEYSKELARFQQEVVPKLRKRLRNKEQECEELKKIINEAKNSKLDLNSFFAIEATVGEYQLELDRLKAENDELKSLLKVRIEDLCDSCGASSMKLMPCKVYEKTLTEIKEIAEIAVNFCKGCGGDDYECIDCTNGGRAQISKEILQKISEVEDES